MDKRIEELIITAETLRMWVFKLEQRITALENQGVTNPNV